MKEEEGKAQLKENFEALYSQGNYNYKRKLQEIYRGLIRLIKKDRKGNKQTIKSKREV